MSKYTHILILILTSVLSLSAEERPDSSALKAMELPDKTIFNQVYANAATTMFRPDNFTNGNIEVSYRYDDNKDLSMLQDGLNFSNYLLSAKGQTVRNNKIFWGRVNYRKFSRDSVQWSDVYDYKRVGPYLIGSELTVDKSGKNDNSQSGGNTFGEEYNLSGGLSVKLKKWTLGGEAGYVAGNSYRKKDPRPLSNATDIYLQISASYSLLQNYAIGMSGQAKRYREKITIEAENESKRYSFYLFKGFGQFNSKHSELDKTYYSGSYKGSDYGGSLFFIPKNRNGLLGNFNFNYGYIEPNASKNSTPYTYNIYSFSADLGWQKVDQSGLSFIKISYDNQLGKGIERIYQENGLFDDMLFLYSAQFYSKRTSLAKLSLGHEWFRKKQILWFVSDIAIEDFNERYAYPYSKATYQHLWASLELGGRFDIGKVSTLIPRVKYQLRHRLSDPTLNLNLSDTYSRLFDLAFAPNYETMFSNLNTLEGEISYAYKMKNKKSLYAKSGGYLTFNGKENKYGLNLSVGLRY